MSDLSLARRQALAWLGERNGDGLFDKTGVLVAAGERAGVMRSTWNALEEGGYVEFYMQRKRLRIANGVNWRQVARGAIGQSADADEVCE